MTQTYTPRALALSVAVLALTAIPAIAAAQTSPAPADNQGEIIATTPVSQNNGQDTQSDDTVADDTTSDFDVVELDLLNEIDFADDIVETLSDIINGDIRDATEEAIRLEVEEGGEFEGEEDDFPNPEEF